MITSVAQSNLIVQLRIFDASLNKISNSLEELHAIESVTIAGNKFLLQSVVCHRGHDLMNGHYVASIRGLGVSSNSWFCVNDTAIEVTFNANLFHGSTPYLLFYEKTPDLPTVVSLHTNADLQSLRNLMDVDGTDLTTRHIWQKVWYTSSVINAYFALLQHKYPHSTEENIFVSSDFMQEALLQQIPKFKKLFSQSHAFEKQRWLFTTNVRNNHWVLLVFYPKHLLLQILDSMYSPKLDYTFVINAFEFALTNLFHLGVHSSHCKVDFDAQT